MTSLHLNSHHIICLISLGIESQLTPPIHQSHLKWSIYNNIQIHTYTTGPTASKAMPTGSGGTSRKTYPVLLLKTKSTPYDGYDEYFSSASSSSSLACQYDPRFIPVLEHKFHDPNLATVKELCVSGSLAQRYGGLIFTSQRAVEGFAGAVRDIRTYVLWA